MKVLFLTNMYPNKENNYYGIFVKEQFEYINNNYDFDSKVYILNGNNLINKYFNLVKLYKEIKKYNPDIIHVHYGLSGLPLLLILPFIKGTKIISTYHGSDINGNKVVLLISKVLNKYSDYNIAVSKEILKKISLFSKNTEWIPCGIDTIFLQPYINNRRKNRIIFPSSPNRNVKNYPLFKEVINLLKKEYNLSPKIVYFDSKSREEIKTLLLESKCLLLTSISEGSPQVIKEAIACDTPIVSTPVGDVPYLIKNLTNCYIEENVENIAEKVAIILNSTTGINPIERKEQLSNKVICDRIVIIYKNILYKNQQ